MNKRKLEFGNFSLFHQCIMCCSFKKIQKLVESFKRNFNLSKTYEHSFFRKNKRPKVLKPFTYQVTSIYTILFIIHCFSSPQGPSFMTSLPQGTMQYVQQVPSNQNKVDPILLYIGPDDLYTIPNENPKLQPNPSAQFVPRLLPTLLGLSV